MAAVQSIISFIYNIFWGDLFQIPLPGGSSLGISLLVLILIPSGIFFTIRTGFVLFRHFVDMIRITTEKKASGNAKSISGFQALVVSTATRVGMGNLAGVVAAVSVGGAGAVFWMWVTAILGSSTAFIEATLAQLHKQSDPLYGGFRGGPAYYIHNFFKKGKQSKSIIAILFAISGLICWGGVSQVIGNSVTSGFEAAFDFAPLYTTILLVTICAIIVLRKDATVKVLDIIVPIMAAIYFIITIAVIVINIAEIPSVFYRIFSEAFGIRQVAGGGIGTVIMMGAKRGLFSNEAGSGSAPCAAAAADIDNPVKGGLLQSFGVFIDTIVICTCTALLLLLAPGGEKLEGMDLLSYAMDYHLGEFGVIFTAIILALFCVSTFIGILFYARSNVAYIFGDNWTSQTIYKIFALIMLFIGGIATYTFVWDLADIGIALMTIFNMIVLFPMAKEPLKMLKEYKKNK